MEVASEEDQNGGRFESLPDDAIGHILNKLFDAKWLCRCSVVCKRFESIVFSRVHSVFFPLAGADQLRLRMHTNCLNEKIESVAESINLSRFGEICHLHLQLPNITARAVLQHSAVKSTDFVEWGAKFGTNLLESFVYLVQFGTKSSTDFTLRFERDPHYLEFMAIGFLKEASVRQVFMAAVAKTHPILQSITITDKNKLGAKLCVSGQRLVELRDLACSMPLNTLLEVLCASMPNELWSGTLPRLTRHVVDGGDDDTAYAQVMAYSMDKGNSISEVVAEILGT